MSWMSELLASYNECKISFMSSHHRKGKSPAKSSTSSSSFISPDAKSQHEILNFMLCDLIPTDPLSQPNTTESQKKSAIANCDIMVPVVLCHEPSAGMEPSDVVTTARSFGLFSAGLPTQSKMQSSLKNRLILAIVDFMVSQTLASVFLPPRPLPKDPVRRRFKLQRSYWRRTLQPCLPSNALADVDFNFPSV